ncbi:MAG: hypothetical protein RQ754_00270 [Desulfuromonadales bacterium]|nr:hypothetical protein [Desulfuromonadales bacterium]
MWKTQLLLLLILASAIAVLPGKAGATAQKQETGYLCQPTPEDEMGPFYRPGAPLRSQIGEGYLLTGTVKSAVDCTGISASLIEFWQADHDGRYDDAHRAAVITGESGYYRLETDVPGEYLTRPAHIHIRVSAPGFRTLVTQHYLHQGATSSVFDLALIPVP